METNDQNLQRINDDEIDLAEVLRQVWAGRWIILITTAVFFAMAVIYLLYGSYSETKEYESQATLLVESPSPDSLITVIKSPLFLSEVLKTNLTGLKPGSTLSVAQVLDQQTKPPQGNLGALTNRINAKKGNAGILVITVMMQDQPTANQLTDSVVQKLIRFLIATQIKRAEKNQKMLAEDSSKNIQLLADRSSRNLQYMSKGASKNIQFQNEGSAKNIQFLKESSTKNIQFQNEGSSKNIQFLTEGYLKAESIYLQSQQALADFYNRNSKNLESIDSLEVKRLNSDIKLKYNMYSALYQQLESAKIDAKKQFEQGKIEGEQQIGQAKIDAAKQLEQAKLDAAKQFDQAKLDAEKQLEQTRIDQAKQIEQVALDAEKKIPVINVLEPATVATPLNVPKAKKVLLLMVFFGFIAGIGIVFGKKFYDKNFAKR